MKLKQLITVLFFITFFNEALLADNTNKSQIIYSQNTQDCFTGPKEYFTGDVRVQMIPHNKDMAARGGLVTFAPKSRSNWHIHSAGQLLIVTDGTGFTQEWGGKVKVIQKGDIVWCPPGVKHWHGAGNNTSMSHIALSSNADGTSVTWLEAVSDSQYNETE